MAISKVVVVTNPTGLHARPAARFVECAKGFESDLRLEKDGKTGNAKSLISLLKLGVEGGTSVTLHADGPDEQAAVAGILEVLAALEEAPDQGACP